jgi:hypothetical protein
MRLGACFHKAVRKNVDLLLFVAPFVSLNVLARRPIGASLIVARAALRLSASWKRCLPTFRGPVQ